MSKRLLIPSFILMLAWASIPFAGEKDKGKEKEKAKGMDNPFLNAKVGDFNSYKLTTKIGDFAIEGTMKMVVSAKDEKSVKLKTEVMVMGVSTPAQETTVDLTKPFDIAATIDQGKKGGKFEKTGEGTSKIKIGGKEYDANWVAGKVTAAAKGLKIDSDVKVWFSKDVPLNGMIKMETKASGANIVIELTEFGSAK